MSPVWIMDEGAVGVPSTTLPPPSGPPFKMRGMRGWDFGLLGDKLAAGPHGGRPQNGARRAPWICEKRQGLHIIERLPTCTAKLTTWLIGGGEVTKKKNWARLTYAKKGRGIVGKVVAGLSGHASTRCGSASWKRWWWWWSGRPRL